MPTLADAAAPLLDPVVVATLRDVLPRLIRAVGRRSLRGAQRWHADIPEAEGASPLDALVKLNQRARTEPAEMTAWLTSAFLADVRENHQRMSAPELRSPCKCVNPERKRHLHNWIVLLDNLDHGAGFRFLADLAMARERHLRQHDEHDPLLIIGTSGRWNPEWEKDWHPPWKSAEGKSKRVRIVPRCRDASYQHWADDSAPVERPWARHYPTLLEPLAIDETAQILDSGPYSRESVLVQRATGGYRGQCTP